MKKIKMLLLLCLLLFVSLAADCNDEPAVPNPGFGLIAERIDLRSFIPSMRRLPGAVTDGVLVKEHDTANGWVWTWRTVAQHHGGDVVANGIASALYRVTAVAEWAECTGRIGHFNSIRAKYNHMVCLLERGHLPGIQLPTLPSAFDSAADAGPFVISGEGFNSTYGMPVIQFTNEYGVLAAQTQAMEVSPEGFWVKGWSGCLSDLPPGHYTVNVFNATADGTGAWVGSSSVEIYNGYQEPPPDPCPPCGDGPCMECGPVN